MNLRKTDKRFRLHKYGFDCYLEFQRSDWHGYLSCISHCRKLFGDEHWLFMEREFTPNGKWRGVPYYGNRHSGSKRIYLRGEKCYTMLLMTMSSDHKETIYL